MTDIARIRLLTTIEHSLDSGRQVVSLANDEDPLTLKDRVGDIERIELHFPHFTDGRAYSQAYLLRRRLGFKGDLRATGDVLIDQLIQMERTGFSSAVLKEGVDPTDAERQFERFPAFYQSDVVNETPVLRRNTPEN
ncbi:DUF934 domain-containing protein [Caballeronia mineralivorans]|jgi:uncharacterized protein (DUF934 family)|uniref:DUF934 domain-containing protein n=1 Tax=Caballeronia mineralivorans TaxID=2010198 RepID=UPI0023F049FD|nr:DUF934 domain-containing protein [Caballeronia mineralivorans]MDB5784694.1 hypothetical protein [Caballeronia mineralivorans]MEA3105227.1 hypothetical protein [Caballeronia mineralivorans]